MTSQSAHRQHNRLAFRRDAYESTSTSYTTRLLLRIKKLFIRYECKSWQTRIKIRYLLKSTRYHVYGWSVSPWICSIELSYANQVTASSKMLPEKGFSNCPIFRDLFGRTSRWAGFLELLLSVIPPFRDRRVYVWMSHSCFSVELKVNL